MLLYQDGNEVRVGDRIHHHGVDAFVEEIIEGNDVAAWNLDEPGFMIICDTCGRVLISPEDADWEDVDFLHRNE